MLFQTSRLLVRPLTFEDFEPFHEMQSNLKVMQYASGKAQTLEENKADLKKVINHYQEVNNGFWIWAMERKSDQALIGTVAIIVDKKKEGEIGYRLLEKHWGNGYATEILKDLINYGFEKMQLKAIHANVDVRNIASIKMLDKSVLEFIGKEWNEDFQSYDRLYRLPTNT
ncbi:MAG: GNAT family N-acetyltransferase [Saprospiraceae bacterium]